MLGNREDPPGLPLADLHGEGEGGDPPNAGGGPRDDSDRS